MSTDWLATGETTDCLVDHCLKDRSRQIFLCRALVDQGLDIGLGKYTASGSDRVDCLIIFCIFIEPGSISLDQGRHLINKRAGSSGTDAVHALLDVAALEVDDLRVLATQFDRYIRLRCSVCQCGRDTDDLLDERNVQMFGECQTAGTGDHRCDCHITLCSTRLGQQIGQCLTDICKMTFVICKK